MAAVSNGRMTSSGVDYLDGLDQLVTKLQSLKKTKAKAAIRKGTRQGSKIVQAVTKRLAPSRTGTLQRNIKVRSLKRSRVWTGVTCQLEVYYGAFTELGFKSRKARRQIPAQHFMQRAAEQARNQAMRVALDTINTEIQKAMV